ncbi:hypothetical protein [Halomicrobium urmianum]|uniref:hypothetical protein n=1 Tax=Halomicrobium urmianum TaxID=1586233 RepID=UPI001CD91B23|nr:hypothetical protein [Halomicrobium urmianum]
MANTDIILFGIAVILFGGFFAVTEALNYATWVNWITGFGLLISLIGLALGNPDVDT